MPTVDLFEGIKINIYNGDHRPPHIHAVYNDYEVLVAIESREIYAGYLPGKPLKKVLHWLTLNSEWALEVFYQLNPTLR